MAICIPAAGKIIRALVARDWLLASGIWLLARITIRFVAICIPAGGKIIRAFVARDWLLASGNWLLARITIRFVAICIPAAGKIIRSFVAKLFVHWWQYHSCNPWRYLKEKFLPREIPIQCDMLPACRKGM